VFYQQQDALIAHLLKLQVTHLYTDYWTCNRIIFASHEQVLCNSLNEQLGPGQDRYLPYHQAVNAAPNPAYVFQQGSPQAKNLSRLLHEQNIPFQESISSNYIIYQPSRSFRLSLAIHSWEIASRSK
jgi:hypothetical protein